MTATSHLLHELIANSAENTPLSVALSATSGSHDYAALHEAVLNFAAACMEVRLDRGSRVAIYLDKRSEFVVSAFGAAAAGCVFVPINPLLKAEQVAYILRDCNVRLLVTSPERHALLRNSLEMCPDLKHVVLTDSGETEEGANRYAEHGWSALASVPIRTGHRITDSDMAAILYTSGSTGRPKGVVLSHRNMVAGAKSVASYLKNTADDTLLAALPLSFDAGFSQLTTGFHVGARVVLLNYLMPRDVIKALEREKVTGLTAVPPLWIQLTQLDWPESIRSHLRYFANTGGRMPLETLKALRSRVPAAKPFLMYGLTEAFRATYLPPEEVDRRPDSIGKSIPNSEVMVLREDGSPCAPNEPGELVQRGALVAMGYWNDVEKTAERFKPLPAGVAGREAGIVIPEIAVYSGDTVKMDEEGFLYFIGRRDEMIKTSGYRVSPTEVEEAIYGTQLVAECAAFGVEHPSLGQAIVLVATPPGDAPIDRNALLAACKARLPAWQVPAHIDLRDGALPRNPNGKIDRKTLSAEFTTLFTEAAK
ncbi:acyl-CoA ligase (AMP-forming), exosortase A system-associated [Niveibacterium sp. 24ML]|uniref:acyl-CoA ligase (AMP-forming), exosortase A system-associated n=1 Tax=Niveibacterium sp. 24ML TaxID=2985512 RepID=UPI0022711C79|nr:acyl-CoA ligase (AMP-forming), exosortase A system-associated [Niveibacterium sp. 24ML]MCX9156868.1 acyl-CoA ligase (AMP-forming), exosortase A system-associated [Niveibacterium sp. 24ML]